MSSRDSARRTEAEIFADLIQLCQEPGFIHALALCTFRDHMILVTDEVTPADLYPLYGKDRFIRTEMVTLAGLLMRGDIDTTFPGLEAVSRTMASAYELMHELHQSLSRPMIDSLREAAKNRKSGPLPLTGAILREAIFYGGEAAHLHQYRNLIERKFGRDDAWLKTNIGFTAKEARVIASSLTNALPNKLMSALEAQRSVPADQRQILGGFNFTAKEIEGLSGENEDTVRAVLDAFSSSAGQNLDFTALGAFNQFTARPILRLASGEYCLLVGVSLMESVFQSPYFWMTADKGYAATANSHRGAFAEELAEQLLGRVFKARVYRGVDILRGKNKVGEVDVLVLFGDRAVVIQAKSKTLTMAARSGNDLSLRNDFEKAVQDAYDQAFTCAECLWDSTCSFELRGRKVEIPTLKEAYPICLVADHYPSLAFQALGFLALKDSDRIRRPFVMDIFTLDVLTEFLHSPLRFLSYLDRRAFVGERVASAHELSILAYHLKKNLWLEDSDGFMMVDDAISAELDACVLVRAGESEGEHTPQGILTAFIGTPIGNIIDEIQAHAAPSTIELGMMLLTLSGETCDAINRHIRTLSARSVVDGKTHDATLRLDGGDTGLTIHCSPAADDEAREDLFSHANARKYRNKANRWFGLCVDPATLRLRFAMTGMFAWEQSDEMDKAVEHVPSFSQQARRTKGTYRAAEKIGRNEPCPCGSGKKFKQCHLGSW